MKATWPLWGLAVACQGAGPGPRDTPEPTVSDTDAVTSTDSDETVVSDTATSRGSLTGACSRTDNALRVRCEVLVEPARAVELSLWRSDGSEPAQVVRSEAAERHEVFFALLAPESSYAWQISAVDDPELVAAGGVRTEALPDSARVSVSVTGESTASHFLLASPCYGGTALIVDRLGEVVWYEPFATDDRGRLLAVSSTEEGTVLGIVSEFGLADNGLREVDLHGRPGLEVTRGAAFTHSLHHDVFRRDGLTYALFQEPIQVGGGTVVLDGFYVFDGLGRQVAEWRLADHWLPPDASNPDPSHANAIWVDEAGDIYVSFRALSTFVKIDGAMGTARFGTILWRLAGMPSSLGNDFTLSSTVDADAAFEAQHNVHLIAPDRFALFDNGVSPVDDSRVITLTVDEAAGTATIDGAWSLGVHCDFQGSAWHTAAGRPVGTCAPINRAQEFEVDGDAATFTLEVACSSGIGSYIPRFVPLQLDSTDE